MTGDPNREKLMEQAFGYLTQLAVGAVAWAGPVPTPDSPEAQSAITEILRRRGIDGSGPVNAQTWVDLAKAAALDDELLGDVDFERDYPAIYELATAASFAQYLRQNRIDPDAGPEL